MGTALVQLQLVKLADPIGLLANWQLWAGLLVGLVLLGGAVYLRRYRDAG